MSLITLAPIALALALQARAAGSPAAPSPAAAGAATPAPGAVPAAQTTPSACTGKRFCDEVNSFAAIITDFRPSIYNESIRLVSATVRFLNKTNRPLILGYVRNAAVAIDEQGNRYQLAQSANVRGIGEIAGGEFDPKFIVQPGQVGDARFEFSWRWDGRAIIGQRAWDIDLTVREVNEVAPGQYRFGQEHALEFKTVTPPAALTSAPPAGAPTGSGLAAVSGGPVPPAAGGIAVPRTAAPAAAGPVAPAAPQEDACAGKRPGTCFDAGPFVAEIANAMPSVVNRSGDWHVITLNMRFRNKTTEPIVLGYVTRSATVIDNFGNRYVPSNPVEATGIGLVDAGKADPQFALRPGETRQATFSQARRLAANTPVGTAYALDLSIAQLEVLYNGQQIRTSREHAMTFPDFALSGPGTTPAPAAAAAPPAGGTTPTPTSIKDAADKLKGIFGGRKK